MSGIIFDENQLTQAIATNSVRGYDNESVYSPDISKLNFFLNQEKVKLDSDTELMFHLSGQIRVVYTVDEDMFKQDVSGKQLAGLPQVLKKYPFIVNVRPIPRPFWARTIPTETSQLRINIIIPDIQS